MTRIILPLFSIHRRKRQSNDMLESLRTISSLQEVGVHSFSNSEEVDCISVYECVCLH